MNNSVLWGIAEALDIVPMPPNRVVASLLASWWAEPRQFVCPSAKSRTWFVIFPDRRIVCANCVARRMNREERCMYCGVEVDPVLDLKLMFEMRGTVTVLGNAHVECQLKADQ